MRNYYQINEATAETANNINSFSQYKAGTATAGYMATVNEVYNLVDEIEKKYPERVEKAAYMADRFAKKYADYLNAYYRNEATCPSILICGAGNFPVRKKERQNSRRESLHKEYNYLMEYKERIKTMLYAHDYIIRADDSDALERLQDKINDLETAKAEMIAINKYYRTHKTLEDYPGDIDDDLMKHINFIISHDWYNGHSLFDTSRNCAEIKRLKARIEEIQKAKDTGTVETAAADESGNELFQIVENAELMRLQLIFEGKPSDEARNILKSNGFKWSPKNEAWQRQLTDNARSALRRIKPQLIAAL